LVTTVEERRVLRPILSFSILVKHQKNLQREKKWAEARRKGEKVKKTSARGFE
jgi:hypothetical protein